MLDLEVFAQLLALFFIVVAGPLVVVLVSIRQGNL
jgi:hypothetical protein